MDTQLYLQRINYTGPLGPTGETLRQLQVAHLLTVPFENLSIHSGEPIILDDTALFDKIVSRRRGGFCYELNGLFAALLRALGFEVVMLSAQVADPEGKPGPEFDHMALMVTLDRRWLVDVGFGDSFLQPLLLDEREAQGQGDRAYRIDLDGAYFVLRQRTDAGDWTTQYRFTLKPYEYSAYAEMCVYHQRLQNRISPGRASVQERPRKDASQSATCVSLSRTPVVVARNARFPAPGNTRQCFESSLEL